jgi:hypothetical protein
LFHAPIDTSDSLDDYKKYTHFSEKGCCNYMLGVVDHDVTDEGGIDEVFLVWIHLQAAHLLALNTIMGAFSFPDFKIPTVSLFILQYSKNHPPPMEDWKVTMDDIFACTSSGNLNPQVNAESVKKVIFDCTIPIKALNHHPVFKNFKQIHCSSGPTPIFRNVAMHCEIVLISITRYYSKILGETDTELIELFKVMSCLIVMPIHLNCCAEFQHLGIKGVLPHLLGALQHLQGLDI